MGLNIHRTEQGGRLFIVFEVDGDEVLRVIVDYDLEIPREYERAITENIREALEPQMVGSSESIAPVERPRQFDIADF